MSEEAPGPEPVAPPASAPSAGGPLPLTLVLVALVLIGLACARGIVDMVGHWFAEGTSYGHGPLIPVAVAWLLRREWPTLVALPRTSSRLAVPCAGLAFLLTGLGLLEDVILFENLALLLGLLGLALLVLGLPPVRATWWAFALLLFMVPLPGFLLDGITVRLKLVAAELSVAAIHLLGVPALLEGGTIHLQSTSVEVAAACAGLKTVVSLTALGAVLACLASDRRRAGLLLAMAIPIAILANAVRILVLCWFSSIGHPAAREGPLHEATGLGVYALALGLFLAISALPLGGSPVPPPVPAGSPAAPPPGRVAAFLACWTLGALLSLLLFLLPAGAPPAERLTERIPAVVGAWRSEELRLGEDELRVLKTSDVVYRRYSRAGGGQVVDLYVTRSGGDIFQVGHAPERCFQGGGFEESERSICELPGGIRANRRLFRRDEERVLVHYWYRLDGRDVAGYLEYRLASFLRRLGRYRSAGSMVQLRADVPQGDVAAAEAALEAFAREALGPALAPLGP